ncbi:ATP-binding protein, partial [Streptomyces sp. SID7982]|nr:ATP-binding protein [Streptomyces sp. SID7982]
REVLENLLVNAAKYAADEGTGERRVWVEAVRVAAPGRAPEEDGGGGADGGTVTALVVRDNGIGIPAGQQADVLQLFR